MKTPSPCSEREAQRMRESAEWLVRLSDGEALSEEELAAWIRWYENDADNARAFEEMQGLWDGLGQLQTPDLAHEASSQRQEQRTVVASANRERSWSVAAARFITSLVTPSKGVRKGFAWSGVLAVGAVSAWAFMTFVSTPAPLRLSPDGALATHLAENQEAVLPDGSRVALGAQSSLVLEYAPEARHLKLTNGQAFFNVAKDKTRPFAVDTGDLQIQAVGTAFDVRKNDGRVAVTVTEGVVEIITDPASHEAGDEGHASTSNQSTPIRVAAGYQLIWDKGSQARGHRRARKETLQLSQVDAAGMTAWREGRLEYVNEPLSVVIANVNRYSAGRLIVEGGDLGSLSFTGTILVNSIDEWLAALQLSFPVSVSKGDDGSLIIRRLSSPASNVRTIPM